MDTLVLFFTDDSAGWVPKECGISESQVLVTFTCKLDVIGVMMFDLVAACMSMMLCGASYGWTSPVLPRLLQPDSEIPMTPAESSWVAAFVEVSHSRSCKIMFGHILHPPRGKVNGGTL